METIPLSDFPLRSFDKVRYADTDRQGHLNNAVFATYLETGRVEFLYDPKAPMPAAGCSFVIVKLDLDLLQEIHWPGQVDIGTGILRVGNSSLELYQQLFQNENCVASARSVIVQMDQLQGRSVPFTEETCKALSKWML